MDIISKKETRIGIRLSPEEQRLLEKLSERENLNKSQYVRFLLKNKERVFTLSLEEKKELKKEFANLSLLSSNINQIAFHLNSEALTQGESKVSTETKRELVILKEQAIGQVSILQTLISNLIEKKSD